MVWIIVNLVLFSLNIKISFKEWWNYIYVCMYYQIHILCKFDF
jgi:hypothetical protein